MITLLRNVISTEKEEASKNVQVNEQGNTKEIKKEPSPIELENSHEESDNEKSDSSNDDVKIIDDEKTKSEKSDDEVSIDSIENDESKFYGIDRKYAVTQKIKAIKMFKQIIKKYGQDKGIGPSFSKDDSIEEYTKKKILYDNLYLCKGNHFFNVHSKRASFDQRSIIVSIVTIFNYSEVEFELLF